MNDIDFDPLGETQDSRYATRLEAEHTDRQGQTVRYLRRRLLPAAEELAVSSEVRVQDAERFDSLAARALGDPEQYWRICDANNAMRPQELLERVGELIRIPGPTAGEL